MPDRFKEYIAIVFVIMVLAFLSYILFPERTREIASNMAAAIILALIIVVLVGFWLASSWRTGSSV
jgi:lipopolysaccharide export LptBFGC system permease protein LptF